MRTFRIAGGAILAAVALAAATAVDAAAAPSTTVRFSATYSGRAVVRVSGETAAISATATGRGTPIGTSKLSGTGKGFNSTPCPVFSGPGVLTASDGSTLKFAVLSGAKSCPGEQVETLNVVSGKATFKGGTKKYAKARGSFTFTGIYDRGKGTFSVKFTGSLTY